MSEPESDKEVIAADLAQRTSVANSHAGNGIADDSHSGNSIGENPHAVWLRLSPLSIVFFLFKVISQLINQALPALMSMGVVIINADDKSSMILLLSGALLLLLVLSSFLEFLFFKFQCQADKIQIHQGVFKKKQRIVAFDKIQNINILQPFYFRPFNLVTLQLETAGSKKSEADLAGISQAEAEQIKQNILAFQKNLAQAEPESLSAADQQSHSDSQQPTILFQSKMSDIIKYGLTSNGMFWFFVFLAPVFSVMQKAIEEWLKSRVESVVEVLGGGAQGGFLFAVLIFFGVILLMLSFSILGAIFRYHNYQLSINKQSLQRKSGLLSTHQESAKLAKIQAFINKTNFIGAYLKLENIILKQASGAINQAGGQGNLFVIPSQTSTQCKNLLKTVLGLTNFHHQLKPINKRYILKTWFMLMAVPVFMASVVFLKTGSLYAMTPLLLGAVFWPLLHLRWKKFGYAIDQHFACFHSGFIGHKRVTFELFKVQRVVISQSPLQKRRNLATLTIYLASLTVKIPYMPMHDAHQWFDKISAKIETEERNWF